MSECETCGGTGEAAAPCVLDRGWCLTCDEPSDGCTGMYGTCGECEGDGVTDE